MLSRSTASTSIGFHQRSLVRIRRIEPRSSTVATMSKILRTINSTLRATGTHKKIINGCCSTSNMHAIIRAAAAATTGHLSSRSHRILNSGIAAAAAAAAANTMHIKFRHRCGHPPRMISITLTGVVRNTCNITIVVSIRLSIPFNLIHTLSPRHIPRSCSEQYGNHDRCVEQERFEGSRTCALHRRVRPRARTYTCAAIVVCCLHVGLFCRTLVHIVCFFIIIVYCPGHGSKGSLRSPRVGTFQAPSPFGNVKKCPFFGNLKSWQKYIFFRSLH